MNLTLEKDKKTLPTEIVPEAVKKERSFGLDLIRCAAILFVMTTHSINYNSLMTNNVLSFAWTVEMIIRYAAMSCVPLFMMLSGYLCRKKTYSRKYFTGLIPILASYTVLSVFSVFVSNHFNVTARTFKDAFYGLFAFSDNGYAWYVEMYIGLFLLIPFLNAGFNALTKKQKLYLIFALAFLTLIPATFKNHTVGGYKLTVFPDYWEIIYPLTYYFTGAYISEYRPRLRVSVRLLLVVAALLFPAVLCFLFTMRDGAYAWYVMNGFGALNAAFTAFTVVICLHDVKTKFRPIKAVAKEISVCSFEMYLFSYMTDIIVFNTVISKPWFPQSHFVKFACMLGCSFALAYVLARIFRLALVPACRALTKKITA